MKNWQPTWSVPTAAAPGWPGKWASWWRALPKYTWSITGSKQKRKKHLDKQKLALTFKISMGTFWHLLFPFSKATNMVWIKKKELAKNTHPQLHTSMAGEYLSSPSSSSGGRYHSVITLLVYGRLCVGREGEGRAGEKQKNSQVKHCLIPTHGDDKHATCWQVRAHEKQSPFWSRQGQAAAYQKVKR